MELVGRGFGDEGGDRSNGHGPGPDAGSARRDDAKDGVEDLPPEPSADEAEEAYPVEAGR